MKDPEKTISDICDFTFYMSYFCFHRWISWLSWWLTPTHNLSVEVSFLFFFFHFVWLVPGWSIHQCFWMGLLYYRWTKSWTTCDVHFGIITWVVPLPSSCHHQDFLHFVIGNSYKPSFATITRKGDSRNYQQNIDVLISGKRRFTGIPY